jgi:hypothetical protein
MAEQHRGESRPHRSAVRGVESPADWRRPMMLWAQKVMVFSDVRPQWKYIKGYGQHMRRKK